MKVISIKKEKILIVIYLIVILGGLIKVFKMETVETFSMPLSKKVVLIDPGHGGFDPGTIGSGNKFEKDINLQISLKLQQFLEQGGAYVLTTRADDSALAERKGADMRGRKYIANSSNADLIVSIHQNSHPQGGVQGSQVFYFNNSEKSKILAESIQNQFKNIVNWNNKKKAMPNSNYYILKQTTIPAVIVECGFMSNYSELQKLQNDDYQTRIAWSIYMGIVDYFNQEKST